MLKACPKCGADDFELVEAPPPHAAKVVCGSCDAFIQWKRKDDPIPPDVAAGYRMPDHPAWPCHPGRTLAEITAAPEGGHDLRRMLAWDRLSHSIRRHVEAHLRATSGSQT